MKRDPVAASVLAATTLGRRARCIVPIAMLLLVAACGDNNGSHSQQAAPAVRTGTFVGRVSGSDTCLAVVAGSQAVVAFASDAANGISIPFGGPRGEDASTLDARSGDHLEVHVVHKRAFGSVTLAGVSRQFTLAPARDPAGLFRAAGKIGDEPIWAGWVVLNDGQQCGSGNTEQGVVPAPPLDLSTQTFTAGDTSVAVAKVEPDAPDTDIEDPGETFVGGAGFAGGIRQFGGFTQFGFGGFGGQFGGGCGQFSGGGFGQFGQQFGQFSGGCGQFNGGGGFAGG